MSRYRNRPFIHSDGSPIASIYKTKNPDEHFAQNIGDPGSFPFTRGIYPDMYREKLWTMRQYSGFGDSESTNSRLKRLLDNGQTGLSLAFDLPTQLGYDADHPLADGEVGKVGLAVSTLADLEQALDGIPLDRVSCSMTINAPAAVLLAMVIAVAEKQGVPADTLSGTVQNDILKEYCARGLYIFPAAPSLRLAVDVMEYAAHRLPKWNSISVSGYHIREAGATAAQELAFTFANALAYLDEGRRRGINAGALLRRMSFFFAAHNLLFEEAAKFRAARRLWARLVRDRYGVADAELLRLRFHAQTGGVTLTAQQPDNNVARVTLQALAAVLGGAQSLHTNAPDEAIGLPTEENAVTALRIQQILALESGAADTVDPLAGSYYVEELTDRLEAEALRLLERIDRMGGSLNAIRLGWMQRQIESSAYATFTRIQSGAQPIVGINCFQEDNASFSEGHFASQQNSNTHVTEQFNRLQTVKQNRNTGKVLKALENIRATAKSSDNLMEPIVEAVKLYATIGEICGVLREEFGEHREERSDVTIPDL
ncbi:acyl-CoA mutase large subunit family protein [Paenibacillus turpanensis]|uniref:acyl-CoA mutase large subunit family protein n=1 Tax=Paenibacillus turpanensis TaxID=2689078 RepID=UPI001A9FD041|nr:methylmalonyl-CoA mutase family protein [Paenibacillus turpanensis]